jgi:hypothetical protein
MLLESSRGILIKPSSQALRVLVVGRAGLPRPSLATFACRASSGVQTPGLNARSFSSSSTSLIKEFFPKPEESGLIRKTTAAWEHPMYVTPTITIPKS